MYFNSFIPLTVPVMTLCMVPNSPNFPPKFCNIHQMNGCPWNDSVSDQKGSISAIRSRTIIRPRGTPKKRIIDGLQNSDLMMMMMMMMMVTMVVVVVEVVVVVVAMTVDDDDDDDDDGDDGGGGGSSSGGGGDDS